MKIFHHNVFIHFYWKKALVTIVFYFILIIVGLINIIFRLLDELVYWGYRHTAINDLIFIISAPRTGTTFMLSLLAADKEQVVTLRNYHFIINSIVFYKMVLFIARIERPLGSPLTKLFRKIGRRLFKGWDGIHPTSFESPEEDEGFWFLSFLSPAWALLVPDFEPFRFLDILDYWSEKDKKPIKKAYNTFLKRIYRAYGKGRRMVVKSVMSSGRVRLIKEIFPDACIITIDRPLEKTLPSYISMFSRPWPGFNKDISVAHYQSIGQSAINLHHYLEDLDKTDWLKLNYKDFISSPMHHMELVYEYAGLTMSQEMKTALEKLIDEKSKYVSGHRYSMEGYGYGVQL